MTPDWLIDFNSVAWVLANGIVAYILFALIVFVIGYIILFDPSATTAGRFILRFVISLVGVMSLVFIGVFIDNKPNEDWLGFPGDTIWWRPAARLLVYGLVASTITSLVVLLMKYKWWPHKIKKSRTQEFVHIRKVDKDHGIS